MSRLWDRGESVDELVLDYCVGNDHRLDERLVPYDVRASIGHAAMLHGAGHLNAAEFAAIEHGLTELARSHARGEWSIERAEEDVHTALENRLTASIGEAGRRVHLGRSRNDQVLAALRLYLDDAIGELQRGAHDVVDGLADLSERTGDVAIPGYTHLQRAMPSSVSLWCGGFAAELDDDVAGLESARRRLSKNPLGSAAGYGTPGLELDRDATRRALGFEEIQVPVTAVQLSRGKAEAGVIFEVTLLMQDLGRLAADLCLFASAEFGFVRLANAFTTGSSIMPQKRNPDVFELVRGRSGQAAADLTAVLGLCSRLPSGYHRDLQLIKEPLFRALDVAAATTEVMARAMSGVEWVAERCAAAMDGSLYATERVNVLVRDERMPFRDAYKQVARDY